MKKIASLLLLVSLIILASNSAFAATTPTPTPKAMLTSELDKQINDLKDRIASRVAQLNLVEKKGIIGTVTDVSETQLTLTDSDGNINFIDVDELTKFTSPSSKGSFGISDINKGVTVGVLGLYNKESRRILARFVDVMNLPIIFSGAIADINKDDYSFTVINSDNKEYTAEVETITKTYTYSSPEDGLVKSGFSKLQIGERVYIVGFFDANDKSKIISSRIIIFPSIAVNPKISIAPTAAPSPTPKSQTKSKSSTSK